MSGVSEAAVAGTKKVPHVFVSYSHRDNTVWPRMERQLQVLENAGRLTWWADPSLLPGDAWDTKIREELSRADVVIALITEDWLASKYVNAIEMEPFRRGATNKRLFPILLKPCNYTAFDWLSPAQILFANASAGQKPLLRLVEPNDIDDAWVAVSHKLHAVLKELAAPHPVPPPPPPPPADDSSPLDIDELQRFWRVRLIARSLPSDVTFDKLRRAAAAAGAGLAGVPRGDALLRSDADQLAALLESEHADGRLEMAQAELGRITSALGIAVHDTSERAWARAAAPPSPPEWAREFIPVKGRPTLLRDVVADEEAQVRWLFVVFPHDWHVSKFGSQLVTESKSALKDTHQVHCFEATLPNSVDDRGLEACSVAAFNGSSKLPGGARDFGEAVNQFVKLSAKGVRAVALIHWNSRSDPAEPSVWKARGEALCRWAAGRPTPEGSLPLHLVTVKAPKGRQEEIFTQLHGLIADFSSDRKGTRCFVRRVEPALDRNEVSDFLRQHGLCDRDKRDDVTTAIQALATGYAHTLALLEDAWALHSDGQGGPIDWDDVLSIWATYRERKAGRA